MDTVRNRIKTKKKKRKYPYTLTPGYDLWSTVEEARGYGVSIKSFGDTRDKLVFHPGMLKEWEGKFDYYWGKGEWGSKSCWSKTKDEDIIKANKFLIEIAVKLKKDYKVGVMKVSGNAKGHLSCVLWTNDFKFDEDQLESDLVLFIYDPMDTTDL